MNQLTSEWLQERKIKLKPITISLACMNCGKNWGIKIFDIRQIHNLGDTWYVCLECNRNIEGEVNNNEQQKEQALN